ncbi:NAD(P)-binding protein [Paenibacillus sp. GYB004]|uniref:NAD(P)-binding protein n=1 Tax=Paenibacillus sp. GYB004 TaxID=2994393 RepID=UPI003FA7CDDB
MKRAQENEKWTFDYVVIGTGPAGAVIAKTLSDDRKTSVLVLEAGENKDNDAPTHLSLKNVFLRFAYCFRKDVLSA